MGAHARAFGRFEYDGDAQTIDFSVRRQTSDENLTELTIDGLAPQGTELPESNRIIVENDHTYVCEIKLSGRDDERTSHVGAWLLALVKRDADASTVTLTAMASSSQVIGVGGFNLTADTTNGSVKLEGSGAVGTNYRWHARVQLTEVRYDGEEPA
jgi:hypothetical protein